jgi:hypothetical protein
MIQNFDLLKRQLSELSTIVNAFKSETVQLRVIELVFAQAVGSVGAAQIADSVSPPLAPTKPKRRKSGKSKEGITEKNDAKPSRRKSGRPGPGAIVDQLLSEGFFDKGKSPNDVVIHCRDEKVLTYKSTEISVSLARAVKSQKLKREKDDNGQFLYIKR